MYQQIKPKPINSLFNNTLKENIESGRAPDSRRLVGLVLTNLFVPDEFGSDNGSSKLILNVSERFKTAL